MNSPLAAQVLNSRLFLDWKEKVVANGNRLESVETLAVVSRNGRDIYSALLDCELLTPEGYRLKRCMMLRGPSVAIIPLLKCEGRVFTALVRQRRIVDGDFSLEFAGGGSQRDNLLSDALNELLEETGISVKPDELIPLNAKPVKVCESLLDEVVSFFYFEKDLTRVELGRLQDSSAGVHSAGEFTRVVVMPFDEVIRIHGFQVMAAMSLLARAKEGIFSEKN